MIYLFFFSSRRRHTRCALVTGVSDVCSSDLSRQTVLETAEALGVNYLCGDASHNAVLEAAAIRRARAVVISAGRDDTSILIVLTARKLSPDAVITVVIRSEIGRAHV